MARISFCMLPEPGHIFPTLRIAQALQSRGHTVSYNSIPELSSYFGSNGFLLNPIFPRFFSTPRQRHLLAAAPGSQTYDKLLSYLRSINMSVEEALAAELRQYSFDLLACDTTLKLTESFCRALGRAVVPVSVVVPNSERASFTEFNEIVLCPKQFDIPHYSAVWNSRTYVEPSVYLGRGAQPTPSNIQDSKPLIYCSFGTQIARYKSLRTVLINLIEAFRRLPYRLVIWINRSADPHLSVNCPPNVQISDNVSQLTMLQNAALFISHGGLGGIKESIMAGVPLLVIPFDYDLPHNAARVVHHGLGCRCNPEEATSERLYELILTILLTPTFRENMKVMQSTFKQIEREAPSVEIISECLKQL